MQPPRNLRLSAGALAASALVACGPSLDADTRLAYEALPATLDYNIDVRPILSDRCWSCHGPDANTRMAGLRLDTPEGAFGATDDHGAAIVPGSRRSEVVRRILSDDPEYRMPTPESHLALAPAEKATLVRWIEDGARYDPHWAFEPLPAVTEARALAPGLVDSFLDVAIAREGLVANERADARTLVRRVYRDLTGLPPTPAQTAAFVTDPSEGHYAALVDSLLATDAHAERLAMEWMDVARYADSHGLHTDGIRTMWPYRDWVIDAFRQNKPYRQFVTEQLAGDLLPAATRDQVLATAFNRNHPMTAEGGAIDEEFRVQYVGDRANTFATAFLGLTMECAACHDHKFDPVSQAEYYQLTAFFDQVKETGMTPEDGDFGPVVTLTDSATEARLHLIDAKIRALEGQVERSGGGVARQIAFIEALPRAPRPVAHLPLDRQRDGYADGYPRAAIQDTLYTVPGVRGRAYYFDTQYDAVDVPLPAFEGYDAFTLALFARTDKREDGKWQSLIGNGGSKDAAWRGVNFELSPDNRLNFRVVHTLPGNYLEVASVDSVRVEEWTHVAVTYDGSMSAAGVKLYVDGRPTPSRVVFDRLFRSAHAVTNNPEKRPVDRALRLGVSYRDRGGEFGIFRGALDEARVYDAQLSEQELAGVYAGDAGRSDFRPAPEAELDHARVLARRRRAPELRELRRERIAAIAAAPDVMVMRDQAEPRVTHLLLRGVYDQPGAVVRPGVPASVGGFDAERYPANRLGLAQWLFSEANPLSARVAVNRYWQLLMGRGLVSTPHDFGMQGALPSHPELLDYLANGFRACGYDLRSLLRTVVLTEAYRRSAASTEEQRRADPENVFLARATPYRYPAESIRDYVLAASGLLVREVGGPSVRPYQPAGLWREKSSFSWDLREYVPQSGDSLYRRSMYTFLRRTSPPPSMNALDMPQRDRCAVTREQTNTPLQALVLLNDPQFVEAARALAQDIDADGERGIDDDLAEAFVRVLGRAPAAAEAEALTGVYEGALARFGESPTGARELLAVGEHPLPPRYDRRHLAALTAATNVLLNHDEVHTRR